MTLEYWAIYNHSTKVFSMSWCSLSERPSILVDRAMANSTQASTIRDNTSEIKIGSTDPRWCY